MRAKSFEMLKWIIKEADKVCDKVITQLIKKEEEFDYDDAVILGLLENLINHSKSMIILLENKHYSSLDTILRTIFENYVYMLFIMEKDTYLRAKSYFYSTKIKELNLLDKLTEDSLDGHKLRKFIGVPKNEIVNTFSSGIDKDYKEEIINLYLNEIGMEWKDQKWYNFDGKTKNFKCLCSKLNLSAEYELIYSTLSIETHAKDAIQNFLIQKDYVGIVDKIKDENLHLSMSSLYLMESVRLIYKYYGLTKELKNFNTLIAINYRYK
jgi:Family of unknown function (DUF5677)